MKVVYYHHLMPSLHQQEATAQPLEGQAASQYTRLVEMVNLWFCCEEGKGKGRLT